MAWLNSIHKDLVFTYDFSKDGVEHTKLYSKASDTHCYLIPTTSCHKSHVLKNIPYGVARRVRQNNFLEQNAVFTQYLLDRGYHSCLIENAFNKFSDLADRKDFYSLKENNDKTTCLLPMVMDQNPALPNMGSIIHRYKHLLNLDPALKKLVRPESVLLFVSHRKNRTIGDMLVHNKYRFSGVKAGMRRGKPLHNRFQKQTNYLWWLFRALRMQGAVPVVNAMFVSKISPCSQFSSHHSKQAFPILKKLICQCTNLIYLIEFNACEQSYVGYTISNLPKRFSNHKSHIKKGLRSCKLELIIF